MDVPNFVIPLNREDLLNSSECQFFLREEFSVEEIQERLEAARVELNEEGINFIKDHFSTYFFLLQKFKQCSRQTREKGWTLIRKSFTLLKRNLETFFEDVPNIDGELRTKMCNLTKMIVYVIMEFMKINQNQYVEQNTNPMDGKSKRKQIKTALDEWNWQDERYSVLLEIHAFLELPIKFLWDPPVVEEEFINAVANFCYNCLEEPGIGNPHMKSLREIIFEILGVLIKNYLHGLSFCVKLVQMLKMNDSMVNPLAQGVVHLVKNCKCSNIVKEIVREIGDTDGDQLAADVSGTRSLNLFLVQLAESIPDTIIPAIDLLISHLNGDCYSMRICVVGVLGEIVLSVLTKENLDENLKNMRDEYLDSLEEHIHDINAFVRVKVLHVWQKLCVGKAIPVSRVNRLLELTIGRLKDKSTNVKKQAVHLIKDLLEGNPFCCQLKVSEIQTQLEEEKKKLEKLENAYLKNCESKWNEMEPKLIKLLEEFDDLEKQNTSCPNTQNSEDPIEDKIDAVGKALIVGDYKIGINLLVELKKEFCEIFNSNAESCSLETLLNILEKIFKQIQQKSVFLNASPDIQEKREKHLSTIEYLTSALEFSELIDRAVPIILTFLDSNVSTDILEAIHFFTAAYLFGFKQALEGVRKMLSLVFSKEANIKTAVSNSYKDIYFQTSGSERHQCIMTITNLTELILKLNFNQLDALEEVIREWVRTGVIDKHFVQVMFERFSRKIPGTNSDQAWAALVLIRMVGAEESKIVKNNISVLLNEGLRVQGSKNFLIAKETCKALKHLLPAKEQGKVFDHTLRYAKDHEIIKTVYNLLKVGVWTTKDSHYIPMADEAINLIFAISHQPDDVCKNLIVDIHESILSKKRPAQNKDLGSGKVLHLENNDDLLCGDSEKEIETDQMEKDVLNEKMVEEIEDFDKIFVILLTRLISIVGQVASNYVLYLEGPILDELKMRNQIEYEKKLKKFDESKKFNSSFRKNRKGNKENVNEKTLETGTEDLEFNRAAADDMDAEEMKKKTENKIVTGSSFLAQFVPLFLNICKHPGKYNNSSLQNAALLTLAKFMTVSSVFCEENLQLLVTICEKSLVSERQENGVISLCALQYRFPNSLEPWTPYMYAMLQHSNPSVRYTSILVLTDLIVNEMIKVRSHISNLAICIVDKDIKIARVARHFFREYSQKGNSLYNVLPSLISNLTQANAVISQEDFKVIMKFILSLFTKEKQSEYLVEKLCQYFESATTDRQLSDLAYCLSLLHYSDKGLKKILDNIRCFANKLYLADVFEAFCSIISEANKNPQKDKTLVGELESIVKEYRDKSCQDRNVYPVRKKDCLTSTKKKVARKKYLPSDSEDEELVEKETRTGQKKRKIIFGKNRASFEEDDDDDDDDAFLSDEPSNKNVGAKTRTQRNKENEISEDDFEKHEKKNQNKVTRHKKVKHNNYAEGYSSENEDEEESNEKKLTKRKKKLYS